MTPPNADDGRPPEGEAETPPADVDDPTPDEAAGPSPDDEARTLRDDAAERPPVDGTASSPEGGSEAPPDDGRDSLPRGGTEPIADERPPDDPAATDDRPDWWRANERLREEMGLPEYRPPRFSDGTYTHRVTEPLEAEHGCRVRFVGANTRYPEDWAVRIDGDPAFGIGRRRDEEGNTVYEMTADAFVAAVERALGDEPG